MADARIVVGDRQLPGWAVEIELLKQCPSLGERKARDVVPVDIADEVHRDAGVGPGIERRHHVVAPHLEFGALRFDVSVCAGAASCMAVDDVIVVNSEGGELLGVGAHDGQIRYRHVFGGATDGDRPRRLEPVLRSGALFVPQSEVHVVRPRDGAPLGK